MLRSVGKQSRKSVESVLKSVSQSLCFACLSFSVYIVRVSVQYPISFVYALDRTNSPMN